MNIPTSNFLMDTLTVMTNTTSISTTLNGMGLNHIRTHINTYHSSIDTRTSRTYTTNIRTAKNVSFSN